MASSSSLESSSNYSPRWKYDVFLSFRGEDTRKKFMGHLYEGLKNRGIHTFKDDISLEYGDSISEELLTAIEESQVALVVFSENYAASIWCLNELVKIMECKYKNGQTVIPIFYDVDPSHVRKQSESFAVAFAEHEKKYKGDVEGMQKVKGWRTALTEAANLSGCETRNRIESECIRDLVDQISKLCKTSLSYLKDIVGIDTHLEEVKAMLQMEVNDVRIVGIWGMGGVGKTTIARAIFNTHSYQFDAASFLADIKENEKKNQLHSLQNTLLSELLRRKDDNVNNKYDGKDKIQSRLHSMKVLIVLDDIDERDHLEYLAGDADCFGDGSKVVVTTRNRDLIKNADAIYEVKLLPDHEATQLFYQFAFKQNNGVPSDQCFKNLSLEVVNHAKGLPLALKVWGSSLHKQDLARWERTIDKIKKNSSSEMVEKLKVSYDGLEPEEQDIFLDIACFLRGEEKRRVMHILESCDFRAEYGLDILIDKSLVFLTEDDTIQMHDLIQDMGKYIVKIQKDPGERSRIWLGEDYEKVMINNTGTKAMEAIWVQHIQKLCLSKKAMKKMKTLRIFSVDGDSIGIEYLPNNLRCFVNICYPRESLPEKFGPKRLVYLDLRLSSLHHLWTGIKHFPCLRTLDLRGSEYLMRTPDFREMPNLEHLFLWGCSSLEEVDGSLGYCGKLIQCDLFECSSLKRFPCVNVESLQYLDLMGCSSLEKFPEIKGRSILGLEIRMGCSKVRELRSFILYLTHLTKLDLSCMENLVSLPSSIGMLKSLVELNLSYCSKLESLPEEIGDLENLVKLDVSECSSLEILPEEIVDLENLVELDVSFCSKLESLPEEIGDLESLVELDVSFCSKLESLPEEIGDLENLERLFASFTLISRPPSSISRLNNLKSLSFEKEQSEVGLQDGVCFVFPQVNGGLRSLEELDLRGCNLIDGGLPEDIGSLSSLKELYLNRNNFENLPRSIAQLGALRILDVSDCMKLTQLPEFPQQLDTIDADWSNDWICDSLFQNISSLQHGISASDSLRVFTSRMNIPSWFQHWGIDRSVSVNLPENWYVSDNFLGFAVCYSGSLTETTAQLIPLCDDGMSWMTQKLALSNHSKYDIEFCLSTIQFFLVPLAGLWDTSKANGKTPNDYGLIRLFFSGELKKFGLRLLYKDKPKLGKRQSRYDDSEASSSSCKKQRSHYNISGSSVFENLQQQVEAPVSSETLQLFPTSSGV